MDTRLYKMINALAWILFLTTIFTFSFNKPLGIIQGILSLSYIIVYEIKNWR